LAPQFKNSESKAQIAQITQTNEGQQMKTKARLSFSTMYAVLLLLMAPTLLKAQCAGVANITVGGTTYAPAWCQEFGGAASSPSTSEWNFDLGNNNGWGNNEAEVYCGPPGYSGNPSQCPTSFNTSTNTVYIDGNGHLVIQPINVGGTWISTRMNTSGTQNFGYGILEASIELPNTTNQGLWPAFWALGDNINTGVAWPTCGESDIMENWSPQVDGGAGTTGNNSTVHTALTGGGGLGDRFTFPSGEATNTAFHTYGIIWQANEMQFFIDNASSPFFTVTPNSLPSGDTWPFNQDLFAILNVAVGGTLGGSISGLSNPGPMTVDYVRWYTPTSSSSEAPFGGTAAAVPGTVLAENYDTGGQGVAYSVASVNGSDNGYRSDGVDLETATAPATGNDLGWTGDGQYFRYTVNVATAGTYKVAFLVAAPGAVTDAFHIDSSSGTNLSGAVAVPATGGYQDWTTVTANVTLPAGTQTLTVDQDAGGWNIDSITFPALSGGANLTTGTPYNIVNQNSGLCVDATGQGTTNGTTLQQYACAGGTDSLQTNQEWIFQSAGGGEYYIEEDANTAETWNVVNNGTTSGSLLQLWTYAGNSNEEFQPVSLGGGYYKFVGQGSGLCLDVPSASTANGVQLQIYTCNGTAAQSFKLVTP
jgi:beta-glucanase (GH16 family)